MCDCLLSSAGYRPTFYRSGCLRAKFAKKEVVSCYHHAMQAWQALQRPRMPSCLCRLHGCTRQRLCTQ